MICKNCGHENIDGAKVCESCGKDLEANNTDKNERNERIKINKEDSRKRTERQRKRSKDKDLMTYGMIIGSVMAFAVIFIVLSYFFKFGAEKEMARKNQIESSISEDTKLYQTAIKKSEETIKAKEYQKAIEILKAIPEDAGEYYTQGQEKLAEVENLIIDDIKKAVGDKNYKEARNLASTYTKLLPESKNLATINEKLKADDDELAKLASEDKEESKEDRDTEEDTEDGKEEDNTDQADGQEARENRRELKEQYDLEMLRRTNSYGQNGNPAYTDIYQESDFLNKSLKIDAHMGEVRTEPNLNSGVAGYVNDGDTVHCEEVVNDGGRYWLKIENGWISSKLITGEFRD